MNYIRSDLDLIQYQKLFILGISRMNGEKRVFTSSCLSVCISLFMHITARLPQDIYSLNLVLGTSMKNLLRNSKFPSNRVKISCNLYEDQDVFLALSATCVAPHYTRHITELAWQDFNICHIVDSDISSSSSSSSCS